MLPRGQRVNFQIEDRQLGKTWALASIRKDAGDDPDVTHGALIVVTVRYVHGHSNISFKAGRGVGIVTKPGLPIAVGEPAINPVPRKMMADAIQGIANKFNSSPNIEIEITVPDGENLALKTWNPRLGIAGGLSILGTTGIVRPYSCSAWIASIHSGIDVARANNTLHVIGSTGSVSEAAAQKLYNLPDHAMLDMGDFVGGLLKYIRKHPVPMITIAGGFGKLSKLAFGAIDLHSKRSTVDFDRLSLIATTANPNISDDAVMNIRNANTTAEVLKITGHKLACIIAEQAREIVKSKLKSAPIICEVLIFDRNGLMTGSASMPEFKSRRT